MTAVDPGRTGLQDWTPTATPALYDVRVGHTRTWPLTNRFSYGGYLWLVDLDELPVLPRGLGWAARFEAADHLGDPTSTLKANVVRFAALNGVDDVARVVMMANARSGPHVFNPLSTHWCYRSDGSLACIVAEVHNTYGEKHAYLLHPDEAGRAEAEKGFYVSPFNTVDGRYLMRFSGPGEQLQVSMALQVGGRTPFVATLRGRARRASSGAVVRTLLRWPFMSLWVAVLIRWQGIRLWARRLPVVPRPSHDPIPGVATNTPGPDTTRTDEDRP